MASKKSGAPIDVKPVADIPEVQAWEDVKNRLSAFKAANPKFFEYLDALIEEYNIKLQDAEKAVRAKQVSCGDFELYQFTTKYNADVLFQALGHERFLQVGGKVKTCTIYEVDKARVEANIASSAIPKEVAEQVKSKTPNYHKPEPGRLP